jgi:uncharacterized protein YcbX
VRVRYTEGVPGEQTESPRVTALSTTPVKSLRISRRETIDVDRRGVRGDRAFMLIDERGRMVNAKHHPTLNQVVAELDGDRLRLRFPDGRLVDGPVTRGNELQIRFHSLMRPVRLIEGPFSHALSEHVGAPLRVVAFADGRPAVDRGAAGAVTLVSRASVDAVAERAGRERVDARRFRMTIEVTGVEPFAEDGWIGREVHVGAATLEPFGNVGRCAVTTLDPETGEVDLPTLDLLREMRADAGTSEPLAIGVHCAVRVGGTVSVGDAVELDTRSDVADLAGSR